MAAETILIIDDNPVNLKLLKVLLAGEGFDVRTSPDAEQALRLLRRFHPRLILADIQLPGMDGMELTKRLKADPRSRDITIVAVTALAMTGDKERVLGAGCDGYVTKPIDTRTFPSLVRSYLAAGTERAEPVRNERDGNPARDPFNGVPGFADLRRRFVAESAAQCRQMLQSLDGLFDSTEAGKVLHEWIGAAGLLGLADISRWSRETEVLLRERPLDGGEVRERLNWLLNGFSGVPQPARPKSQTARTGSRTLGMTSEPTGAYAAMAGL